MQGLAWRAVGPGPDPAVLIETRIAINGTVFRLLGFRVPMPYSVGWSINASWEDDKGFQSGGLLWDVDMYRRFVRESDAGEDASASGTLEPDVSLDDSMERLTFAWLRLCVALGGAGQDWRPATVWGAPYILVGHPDPGGGEASFVLALAPADGRSWFGQPDRVHSFNMTIEGGSFGLDCAEVRLIAEVGTAPAGDRPMGPAAAASLAAAASVMAEIPGALSGPMLPLVVGGRAMAGIIRPIDADIWSFDARRFLVSASPGLRRGRMRWFLDIPLNPIDGTAARAVEGVARMIRERRVARLGPDACVMLRMADVPAALGLDGSISTDALRSAVLARVYKVAMRGYGRREDGVPVFCHSGLSTRLYAFADTLYLAVSPAFARIADAAADGEMEALTGCALFETPLDDQVSEPPGWIAELPPVADGRIRAFVTSLSGSA